LDPNNKDSKIKTTKQQEESQKLLDAMREELKAKQELDNIKKYGDPDPLNTAKSSDDILKEIDKFEKQAQNHQRKM
jgi:hypothetical protein